METETVPAMTTTDPALQPLCDAIVGCCDDYSGRYSLMQPRVVDGVLYATDGWIAVRMRSGFESFAPRPDSGHFPKMIGDIFADAMKSPVWTAAPPYVPCDYCNDVPSRDCEDCDGEGDRECSECGHVTRCDTCDGDGRLGVCQQCRKEAIRVVDISLLRKRWRTVCAFSPCGHLEVAPLDNRIAFRVLGANGAVIADGVLMSMKQKD